MFDFLLPHLRRILAWITLRRVLLLAFGSIVWIISLTMFENRSRFVELGQQQLPRPSEIVKLKISADTTERIKGVVDRNANVNFMMVISASILRNQRELTFWYTDDPLIEVEIEAYLQNSGSTTQLLGADDSVNAAIIRAINGDFACYDNTNSLIVPDLNRRVKRICRVSIPPYYGQFSGYLTFGLTQELTPEQIALLRRDAVEITSDIYFDNLRRLNAR